MRKRLPKDTLLLLVLGFLAPVLVFGLWQQLDKRSPPEVYYDGRPIGAFALRNQRDSIESAAGWTGNIVVANLFFTRCPSICPAVIKNMRRVRQAFANDRSLLLASFSIDPEYDSVARLQQYISRFHIDDRGWDFVTGSKKTIYLLARNDFRLVAAQDKPDSDDFIHSEDLVLIDSHKRIRGYYSGTRADQVDRLIADIKKLKHETPYFHSK